MGVPGGSDGKEPSWDAGNLGSIPESERSHREGNDILPAVKSMNFTYTLCHACIIALS